MPSLGPPALRAEGGKGREEGERGGASPASPYGPSHGSPGGVPGRGAAWRGRVGHRPGCSESPRGSTREHRGSGAHSHSTLTGVRR
eukprot:scaffold6092_cov359-Prasinococcus_capsulatus_cf.AAC.4